MNTQNEQQNNSLRRYSLSQINQLARELGHDPQDIAGATRTERATNLYDYVVRRSLEDKLAELLQKPACPYPGERAYREDEVYFFPGRAREREEIATELASGGGVWLEGASGSGKTSLVAAVLADLKQQGRWLICQCHEETDEEPTASLARTLVGSLSEEKSNQLKASLFPSEQPSVPFLGATTPAGELWQATKEWMATFVESVRRGDPSTEQLPKLVSKGVLILWDMLFPPQQTRSALDKQAVELLANIVNSRLANEAAAERMLVVIDPLERFVEAAAPREQATFVAMVKALFGHPKVALLVAVREDCPASQPTLKELKSNWKDISLSALDLSALQEVIREPAQVQRVEVRIHKELVKGLARGVAKEPGALTILQKTMRRLWGKFSFHRLRLNDFNLAGDTHQTELTATLAAHANGILGQVKSDEVSVKRLLLRLIEVGTDGTYSHRLQPITNLLDIANTPKEASRIIDTLIAKRLLTREREGVRLAHIGFCTACEELSKWIATYHAAEEQRRKWESHVRAYRQAEEAQRKAKGDLPKEREAAKRKEATLLPEQEITKAISWPATAEEQELGAVPGLQALVRQSWRAINPGWHPWGTVALGVGGVALVALVGLLFLVARTLSPTERGLALILAGGMGVGLLALLGPPLRAKYGLPQLSHTIPRSRPRQILLTLLCVGTIGGWGQFGVTEAERGRHCRPYDEAIVGEDRKLAISAQERPQDSPGLQIMRSILNDNDHYRIQAWVLSDEEVKLCRTSFDYVVEVVGPLVINTNPNEQGYQAILTPQSPTEKKVTLRSWKDAGCLPYLDLAHQIADHLGSGLYRADPGLTEPVKTCMGDLLNQIRPRLTKSKESRSESYEWAVMELKEIVAAEPHYASARIQLADLYTYLGRPQEALKILEPIQLREERLLAIPFIADAYYQLQEYQAAINTLQELHRYSRPTVTIILMEQRSYREAGQYEEAERLLDELEAMEFRIDYDVASSQTLTKIQLLTNRGILAYRQTQNEQALQYLEEALALTSPPEPHVQYPTDEILFYMAQIYESQGEKDIACDFWRRYDKVPDEGYNGGARARQRREQAAASVSLCRPPEPQSKTGRDNSFQPIF